MSWQLTSVVQRGPKEGLGYWGGRVKGYDRKKWRDLWPQETPSEKKYSDAFSTDLPDLSTQMLGDLRWSWFVTYSLVSVIFIRSSEIGQNTQESVPDANGEVGVETTNSENRKDKVLVTGGMLSSKFRLTKDGVVQWNNEEGTYFIVPR